MLKCIKCVLKFQRIFFWCRMHHSMIRIDSEALYFMMAGMKEREQAVWVTHWVISEKIVSRTYVGSSGISEELWSLWWKFLGIFIKSKLFGVYSLQHWYLECLCLYQGGPILKSDPTPKKLPPALLQQISSPLEIAGRKVLIFYTIWEFTFRVKPRNVARLCFWGKNKFLVFPSSLQIINSEKDGLPPPCAKKMFTYPSVFQSKLVW